MLFKSIFLLTWRNSFNSCSELIILVRKLCGCHWFSRIDACFLGLGRFWVESFLGFFKSLLILQSHLITLKSLKSVSLSDFYIIRSILYYWCTILNSFRFPYSGFRGYTYWFVWNSLLLYLLIAAVGIEASKWLSNLLRVWVLIVNAVTKLFWVWFLFSLQVTLFRVYLVRISALGLAAVWLLLRGFLREMLVLIQSLEVRVS